jgi:type I restriction enzyme, S subunit
MSDLPNGWAIFALPQVAVVLDTRRIPLNADERTRRIAGKAADSLVPYYGATGQVGWIDEALFDENLVLLGEDGAPFLDLQKQKAYRIAGKSWVNNHAHVLRAREGVMDWRLLEHLLNTIDYTGFVTGTTRLKLTQGAMNTLPILVPPFQEQTRIANQLDTLLARVQACNDRFDAIPTLLKRFRQTVLDAALNGAFLEGPAVTESELPKVSISAIATVGTGSTPLRTNSQFFAISGTPWITSSATSAAVITSANEFVTPAAISAHRLKIFPKGTLLVAMYGEGKTRGQVAELGIDATINQACAAVVVNESKAVRAYVKLALQANYLNMRELAEGGNQPNLNLSKVKEFEIPLPSLADQAEIVRRVEALFALADRIEARCTAARTQSQRLTPLVLAKAFRGELVQQDPNDEPANALLARIASSDTAAARKNKRKVPVAPMEPAQAAMNL